MFCMQLQARELCPISVVVNIFEMLQNDYAIFEFSKFSSYIDKRHSQDRYTKLQSLSTIHRKMVRVYLVGV